MGNFREKADTKKFTSEGQHDKYHYAVSHMCGKYPIIEVGDCTWRTHTSQLLHLAIRNLASLESSMATEVFSHLFRPLMRNIC